MGFELFEKRQEISLVATAFILAAGLATAGPVEQVNVAGTGTGGHTAIQTAVDAVDDGGVVEIIEAATYIGPVDLPGGKTFTIRGTVPGVISEQLDGGGHWTANGGTGAVNVTIEDMSITRDEGSGTVIDIDQRLADTVTITLNRVDVIHTLTASGGEAIKIDDGGNGATGGAATVTLNATDCTFTASTTSGSGKSAIRVQSDATDIIDNLVVNLTNCVLTATNEGTIRTDGRNNQNWTLTGCTINAPIDVGFEVDDPASNSSYTFIDTTITAGQECLKIDDLSSNCTVIFRQCTLDNRTPFDTVGGGDYNLRIDFNSAGLGTGNSAEVSNCLIYTHDLANGRGVSLDAVDVAAIFHHNTIVAIPTGSGLSEGNRGLSSSNSVAYDFSNNVIINFADPVSGSTGTKEGNAIAGSADDTSAGATHIFEAITAGDLAAARTALNLDASYVPLLTPPASSSVVAYGVNGLVDLSSAALDADIDGVTRPTGGATPDSGCYEVDEGAGIGDWQMMN